MGRPKRLEDNANEQKIARTVKHTRSQSSQKSLSETDSKSIKRSEYAIVTRSRSKKIGVLDEQSYNIGKTRSKPAVKKIITSLKSTIQPITKTSLMSNTTVTVMSPNESQLLQSNVTIRRNKNKIPSKYPITSPLSNNEGRLKINVTIRRNKNKIPSKSSITSTVDEAKSISGTAEFVELGNQRKSKKDTIVTGSRNKRSQSQIVTKSRSNAQKMDRKVTKQPEIITSVHSVDFQFFFFCLDR